MYPLQSQLQMIMTTLSQTGKAEGIDGGSRQAQSQLYLLQI